MNTFEVAYTGSCTVISSKTLLLDLAAMAWSTDREASISRKATGYLLSMQACLGEIISVECDRETMFCKMQMIQLRTSVEAELRRRWSPRLLAYTR